MAFNVSVRWNPKTQEFYADVEGSETLISQEIAAVLVQQQQVEMLGRVHEALAKISDGLVDLDGTIGQGG